MSRIWRVLRILIVLELAYLALFNTLLNISLTQDLINRVKPDKFEVNWEGAWTLYPFRVHAYGISANGQARSQQWFLESTAASGSISLLPLIMKKVNLSKIQAQNITYHQRPRPKPDKDFSSIREYFPPIPGRELETRSPQLPDPKPGKKPWHITIADIQASGEHSLWLYQAQARIKGEARTSLSAVTRGGPVSLDGGEVDLELESLMLAGNREVTRNAHIKGSVALRPLVIKQNRGLAALTFLQTDLEIQARAENLAFLNLYMKAFEGMRLSGAGALEGRLVLQQGMLLPGSTLSIQADTLGLSLLNYRVEGDGNILIETPQPDADSTPDTRFAIAFNDLQAFYNSDPAALLTGNGLILNGTGSNTLIPTEANPLEAKSLVLSISELEAPDLGGFQRFLPDNWPFRLHGGSGEVTGQIAVQQNSIASDVRLHSEAAEVGFNELQFSSNLDMGLNVSSPDLETGRIELSGTHLSISETEVSGNHQQSEPWHAAITIEKGIIELNVDEAEPGMSGTRHIARALKEKEIGELLASSDEELIIKGEISDLAWLNVLLPNPYELEVHGFGGITSEVRIEAGQLGEGSRLDIVPQEISVEFLDYVASGDGNISLAVTEGGATPDMALDVEVRDAELKRRQEEQVFVEEVEMQLQALIRDIDPGKENEEIELHLNIDSARINDMAAYNSYLPPKSPLQITGGEASLVADIELRPRAADGYLKLESHGLSARVDEQDVSAALHADIQLSGGTPREMEFDISGSTLTLDEVRVIGEESNFREDDWGADISFLKASTVWKKPIKLEVEADIAMTDSIPLVSMLANHRGKHGWLENALTVDDVAGNFDLRVADEQIVVPYAFAGSDNIDVGAKAIISEQQRNGRVFVRYKALKGLLKVDDGKRNIDILNAREKFDEYSTEEVIREKSL